MNRFHNTPQSRAQGGRSALWLVLALALGWILWWVSQRGEHPGNSGPLAGAAPQTSAEDLAAEQGGQRGPSSRTAAAPAMPRSQDAQQLSQAGPALPARGSIRGELQFAPGLSPRPWKLHLGPSRVLFGREQAIVRELEFDAQQLEFALDDLPLAGYDLWASAEGGNASPQPILLVPGSEAVHAVLILAPAGQLIGSVLDSAGLGIEGIQLTLVSKADGPRRETLSNPLGRFSFESLPDGPYELRLGPSEAPLMAPRELSFAAPSLELEPLRPPALHALQILVLDAQGHPVQAARVRGYSTGGGIVDVSTDSEGRARGHLVAPGRVSLRTAVPDLGHGYTEVTIEEGAQQLPTATLTLSP